jgi:hypothetical protein
MNVAGIPKRENSMVKHFTTVAVDISGHGKTNGIREYSSMMFKKFF